MNTDNANQRYLKFKRIHRRGAEIAESMIIYSAEKAEIYKNRCFADLGIGVFCFPASHRKTK